MGSSYFGSSYLVLNTVAERIPWLFTASMKSTIGANDLAPDSAIFLA